MSTAPIDQIVKYIFDECNVHFGRVYREIQNLKEEVEAIDNLAMDNGAGQAILSAGVEKCVATLRLHDEALKNIPGYMDGHTAELLKVRAELEQSNVVTAAFAKDTVAQVDAINLRVEAANLDALAVSFKALEESVDKLSARTDQGLETVAQQQADIMEHNERVEKANVAKFNASTKMVGEFRQDLLARILHVYEDVGTRSECWRRRSP